MRALADGGLHRWVGEIEAVVVHEDVDAGRVAAADFEPVERRERLLDREVRGERTLAGIPAGELGDLTAVRSRSLRTAQSASRSAIASAPRRSSSSAVRSSASSRAVDVSREGIELVEAGRDRGHELRPVDERHQAREGP